MEASHERPGLGERAVEAVENFLHKDVRLRGEETGDARKLGNRSVVTGTGDPFCKNPNDEHLAKEFETRVQIVQRYPEMKQVEETFFVKQIRNEERTIVVPRTRVLMEDHERIDIVPVLKKVPKTRIEIVHRVVTEEREVTEMVDEVQMVEVPRIEVIPRVITEDVEERVTVPVVIEVPHTRIVEVPTGNFCEAPAGEYVNPGHFNLLGKGHGFLKKSTRSGSSSSSSSDDEKKERKGRRLKDATLGTLGGANGVARKTGRSSSSSSSSDEGHRLESIQAPATPGRTSQKKKPSLLQRIEAKLTG